MPGDILRARSSLKESGSGVEGCCWSNGAATEARVVASPAPSFEIAIALFSDRTTVRVPTRGVPFER